MSAAWKPTDDELDALARGLPVAERAADRVEQERTSVLAQAAQATQQSRGSRVPMFAGAAVAVAAAAALILWLVARPGAGDPHETINALGVARYERATGWPDFQVRLDDGRIDVRVSALAAGERFRVITRDAEVEVRGTQFVVGADHGKLASVAVAEGRVEVRWAHEPPVFLGAGESWSPTRTAQRDELPVPQSARTDDTTAPAQDTAPAQGTPTTTAVDPAPSKPQSTAVAPTPNKPAVVDTQVTNLDTKPTKKPAVVDTKPAIVDTKPAGKPAVVDTKPAIVEGKPGGKPAVVDTTTDSKPARPGEADFRAGIASLRAGDAAAATRSFAVACTDARKDALGDDACFWYGAAAKRAGQTATAREALTRFLATYPSSARAGEASALLGWLLYDAGELDAARQRFEVASRDRVAKVKDSADRGLEAIKRRRSTP